MPDLNQREADNLKTLLTEKEIDKKKLAEIADVSLQSVYAWLRGTQMNRDKAERINREYPEYSVEWILGYTKYKSEDMRLWELFLETGFRNDYLVKLTTKLLNARGFETIKREEDPELEWFQQEAERGSYRISRDEKSIVLTNKQCIYLAHEIADYAEMRVNAMFERGGWNG